MVLEDPEKYGHIMMDKAIHIEELIERNKEDNTVLVKQMKKKAEKLKISHFKRMFPKK
jgi:hypothetical protein